MTAISGAIYGNHAPKGQRGHEYPRILTAYPHLIGLFKENGLEKFEKPEILEKLGRF